MIWLKICGVVALIGAAIGFYTYERTRAYNEGVTYERLVWQQRQAAALNKSIADFKAETARRNDIEKGLLAQLVDRDKALADVETALQQEKTDATPPTGGPCRPAVPRRVRDALDAIH
jgi:hypothetical protein